MHRFIVAAALCSSAPYALAQTAALDATCIIVFSQPRNASQTDPKVNQMWNDLNKAFNQFVADELSAGGRRVIKMPHPVEARDTQANVERLMKRARTDGCDTIVDVVMFADQRSQRLISRMRVHPVVVTKVEEPAGTDYSVGPEAFSDQRADPLSSETLDRLVPSEIAKRLVASYLAGKPK